MNNFQLKKLPPLSMYIHLPWCIKKCPYCDFNSHDKVRNIPEAEYIEALINDLENALPLIWGRIVYTIFIGGGTPSLFSPQMIDKLLKAVRSRVQLSPFAEITIEANPGTVDNDNIIGYSQAGVNRISIGVQTFNETHLQKLGRIHNSEQAFNAINIAKKYFNNINIDLMYALPTQTKVQAVTDINTAITFDVEHISSYNLTIEPNTAFYKNTPQGIPSNDTCYAMQDDIKQLLENHGYEHYEVSAYGKKKCQHNLNYWLFGDYLGIGAGSHTKLSFHDKIIRQVRQKQPSSYMRDIKTNKHIIENKIAENLPFEFALNAFRLMAPIPITLFTERTGLSLSQLLPFLYQGQEKKLLQLNSDNITITQLGHDFLNDLLLIFLEN